MFEPKSLTPLESIGEFGMIDMIKSSFESIYSEKLVCGIGDDAAVFHLNEDFDGVVSTDLLVEGIHFDLSYVPLKHLGYKAVSVNLSDIAAMGATPDFITVSLAVSSKFSVEAIEEIYAGIQLACSKYQVALAGGDTSASRQGMVISVTAFGRVKKGHAIYRKGASAGELVCVTGDLGSAYLGLQVLEREKKIFLEHPETKPDLEGFDYILERQLKPEPRLDILKWIQEKNATPTSMMDISDGLSSELQHICRMSQVGMDIYEDKLPVDAVAAKQCLELGLEPTLCALHGGEDYELLMTFKLSDWDIIKGNKDIHIIGHCTDAIEKVSFVTRNGSRHEIKAGGWQSFGQ